MALYSPTPTPWRVDCDMCGPQYLSKEFYLRQLNAPNICWRCPCCGQDAYWDDAHHEAFMDALPEKAIL